MIRIAVIPGVGVLHAIGSYTGFRYSIPPTGIAVHPYDAPEILAQERTFCCGERGKPRVVKPFFEARPIMGQLEYVEVPDPPRPTLGERVELAEREPSAEAADGLHELDEAFVKPSRRQTKQQTPIEKEVT